MPANILFLVDTSVSMGQWALIDGVPKSYLDIAKGAVETFVNSCHRKREKMGDRFMLLTFDDPPDHVKKGWQEELSPFWHELKNLQCNGLTSMGSALQNVFNLLNLNRMRSGTDTYGHGRCPFILEQSIIIVLTDGGKYTSKNGVQQMLLLPQEKTELAPGSDLTKEPFRWDQLLFSLVLRIPGHPIEPTNCKEVPRDESLIERMCMVTGGRSYKIRSRDDLDLSLESLLHELWPGVVLHFEQFVSKSADAPLDSGKRILYMCKVHPKQKTLPFGHWPIPESYWTDPDMVALPARDAHPKLKIMDTCCDEPAVLRKFPIDKYELNMINFPSYIYDLPFVSWPTKVWPVMVQSGTERDELPFGYLKPSNTRKVVYLYVLPYNYPALWPLLQQDNLTERPPPYWVQRFNFYLSTIPQYYCPFLRRALIAADVPEQVVKYLLPDHCDNYLNPAIIDYIQQKRNSAENIQQLEQPTSAYQQQVKTVKLIVPPKTDHNIVSHPLLKTVPEFLKMQDEIVSFDDRMVVIPSNSRRPEPTKNYRNPYDIPRQSLVDDVARMRKNFFQLPTSAIRTEPIDTGNSQPIATMGDYQKHKKVQDLRELEPSSERESPFGNPFKRVKKVE